MTLRKIAFDNSVRYIPNSEKPKERDLKPKTIKASSLPRKQSKNISQNSEKLLKNISAQGCKYITKQYLYKY